MFTETNYYQLYKDQLIKLKMEPMTKYEWDQLQAKGAEIEAMYKLKYELINQVIK